MIYNKIKRAVSFGAHLLIGAFIFVNTNAQSPVVVIPLFGDDPTPLQNIITVSPSGGDFTNPIAALASIPMVGPEAPSANNPYLIVIGPGDYTLASQLVMKAHVSISGSGVAATSLIGSVSGALSSGEFFDASSALVVTAANATLSHLTISNQTTNDSQASQGVFHTGGTTLKHVSVDVNSSSARASGITSTFSGGVLSHVKIVVNNSSGNSVGMENNSSPVFIDNLSVDSVSAGRIAVGMANNFSAVRMNTVRVSAIGLSPGTRATGIGYSEEGGTFINELSNGKVIVSTGTLGIATGVLVDGAAPRLSHIDIELRSGKDGTGILTIGQSQSKVTHCNVRVVGEEFATGVSVAGDSAVSLIEHCTIDVTRPSFFPSSIVAGGVAEASGHLVVSHSLFRSGGVSTSTGGEADCVFASSEFGFGQFFQMDANCQLPGP